MWRVAFILFIVFPFSVFAECVSVEKITKCARLPEDRLALPLISDKRYDESTWGGVYNGHVLSGTGQVRDAGNFPSTICVLEYPFYSTSTCFGGPGADKTNGNYNCVNTMVCDNIPFFSDFTKLSADKCPDGFYTIPYEISCGDGLVEVSGVPHCDDDMSGDYCLMSASVAPCAAGVTTLRTGTGLSIPLWAEKLTEPSLCVKYNGVVCYGNMEPGRVSGGVNIKYGDLIYHLTD